jgi:hypothetical protein
MDILERVTEARKQLRSTQLNWREDCLFECDHILSQVIDHLNAAPVAQQPAAEPERFKVGDVVESDWTNRNDSSAGVPEWRPAKITRVVPHRKSIYDVVFDGDSENYVYVMKPHEVRRPAPVAPRKFEFGERVRVGKSNHNVFDYSGVDAFFLSENSSGEFRVAVNANGKTFDFFAPDQVHHID